MKQNVITVKAIKYLLGITCLLILACGTEKRINTNENVGYIPILTINPNTLNPFEIEVSQMADSLFDGRPHIIADESFYTLSSKQIELLRTFNNPHAPYIISLIESIDSVMHSNNDTITSRQALMSYYHFYDLLDKMTGNLTQEEQSKIFEMSNQ